MNAAFIVFIVGMIIGVLGWAEIKRAAQQGPGTAVAGIIFAVVGAALIVIAVTRFIFWE